MKPHPDDPKLTAFLLGELPPEERAQVEFAIATDPAVSLAVEELERMQTHLHDVLGGGREVLLPRQRENIRKAAREASRQGKIIQLESHKQPRKLWVPVAAAAGIAAGVFALTLIPAPEAGRGIRQVSTASGDPAPAETSRPIPREQEGDMTLLPLQAKRKSLSQITQAVRVDERLPSQDEVRIEEMFNAFPLQARDSVAHSEGCTLGADVLPCPWKPSGTLVFVSIQAARDAGRKLSVRYVPNAESVTSHRLIGFVGVTEEGGSVAESEMDAGGRMFLAIEVAARTSSLGRLVWTVDGKNAPPIELVRDSGREPSDDVRFAALIWCFGLWLKGEEAPMVDDSLVLGLAREVAAESLAPDRYDFLNLVDQAVRLRR